MSANQPGDHSQGDVVVADAGDVLVENVEDVFVAPRAGAQSVTVSGAQDVYLQADGSDHRDVYHDNVADTGADIHVSDGEDVLVQQRAVRGQVQIRGAEDVYLATLTDATVETVQDVFVEGDAVSREHVTLQHAEDVHFEQRSVLGDVAVENPEHVKHDGDPARTLTEEGTLSYSTREAVTVRNVEDVHLADDAVDGEVHVSDADDVIEDDGWLF